MRVAWDELATSTDEHSDAKLPLALSDRTAAAGLSAVIRAQRLTAVGPSAAVGRASPTLPIPELLHHQERFVGCLAIRRVPRYRPLEQLACGESVHRLSAIVVDELDALAGRLLFTAGARFSIGTQAIDYASLGGCPARLSAGSDCVFLCARVGRLEPCRAQAGPLRIWRTGGCATGSSSSSRRNLDSQKWRDINDLPRTSWPYSFSLQ